MIYLWVKVLHVLAVISWMAGLFYLPRLFVYHADRPVAGEGDEIFKIMERRLLKAIMRPAAVVVALTGSVLLYVLALPLVEPWVALKLLAVILMFGFHGVLERHAGEFRAGKRLHSGGYFRVINEIPTLLLIVIVILVVVRPFS